MRAFNPTFLLEIACGALMIFGVPLAAWFVL